MNSSNYLIKSRYKKRHRFGRFLLWVIILGIIAWGYLAISDVYGWSGSSAEKTLEIQSGSNISQVAKQLEKEGIISHSFLFRAVAKMTGSNGEVKMGSHILRSNMSYFAIVNEIKAISKEEGTKVTIPEGFESYKIADTLAEKGLANKDSFQKKISSGDYDFTFSKDIKRTTNRLEGYLFPATYVFKEGTTEDDIIKTMLNKFDEEFDQTMKDRAQVLGMTVDQVVTLASIIEREAKNSEEMPIISSIFHNRLKKNSPYPYLQSCATIQYLLKERKAVLSVEDTKIKSPYNTYTHKGLPPGPIANPGKPALMAALYPEDSDYNFFVLNKEGTHHIYSKTFAEHEKAVKENQ